MANTASSATKLSSSQRQTKTGTTGSFGASAGKSMHPPVTQKGSPAKGSPGNSGRPGIRQTQDSSRFAKPSPGASAGKSMRPTKTVKGTGKGKGSSSKGGFGRA